MWRKKNIWLKFFKNDENYKPIVPRSLTNPKLKKEMATHSSVLAWRIPGTREPFGLPSMGLHRVGHDWSDSAAAAAASLKKMKKTIPRHIIINLLKSSEKKRKIFKAGRGNNDGLNTQGTETDDSWFLVRNNANK